MPTRARPDLADVSTAVVLFRARRRPLRCLNDHDPRHDRGGMCRRSSSGWARPGRALGRPGRRMRAFPTWCRPPPVRVPPDGADGSSARTSSDALREAGVSVGVDDVEPSGNAGRSTRQREWLGHRERESEGEEARQGQLRRARDSARPERSMPPAFRAIGRDPVVAGCGYVPAGMGSIANGRFGTLFQRSPRSSIRRTPIVPAANKSDFDALFTVRAVGPSGDPGDRCGDSLRRGCRVRRSAESHQLCEIVQLHARRITRTCDRRSRKPPPRRALRAARGAAAARPRSRPRTP